MAQSPQDGPGCGRSGLILGKFMPLTLGHCYLIDTALAQVDKLTVLVCTLRREPIDGHLRYQWVRATYPPEIYPQCKVVHVTDEVPSYPHEHSDFWSIWKSLILRYVPDVDVVFTSEEYGDKLASVLGCRHVCVDIHRHKVPISATRVRADPLLNWEYIPPAVQPYYSAHLQPEARSHSSLPARPGSTQE
ncbi:MAG: adenylyltransferase/cytidyltransferase family protein [Chloroflexia bacterium]